MKRPEGLQMTRNELDHLMNVLKEHIDDAVKREMEAVRDIVKLEAERLVRDFSDEALRNVIRRIIEQRLFVHAEIRLDEKS